MPKYIPTPEEMMPRKPCGYCGKDFDPFTETEDFCCSTCEHLYESYREDMEWFLLEDYVRNESFQ